MTMSDKILTPAGGALRRRRASMSVALGFVLGAFVLVAVASVMAVGIWSGYSNTVELLRQKAEVLVSTAEAQTTQYLDAAEQQAAFVAGMISAGEATPGVNEEFTKLLLGALAAAPQIVAILYVDPEYNLVAAERDETGVRPLYMKAANDDGIVAALRSARANAGGMWDGVAWREEYQQALLRFQHTVMVDGGFAGVVIALISARNLSRFISELDAEFGNNAFVLYGADEVLAHPTMAFDYPGLTALDPLPRVATFGDPVLSSLWDESARVELESGVFGRSNGHAVALGGEVYAFLYRELPGYGDRPLQIGTYFRSSDLFSEVLRLKWALIACLGILLASVTTAAATGRRIATPVRRLAEGATRVHALDLDNVPRIPGSFFREINDAAASFNSMLDGLRWFERYVPRPLVSRLMSLQGAEAVRSMERTVTVMFTDIADFTSLSENIPAAEVADLLNHHFTLVAACVEAEGGTVDKFIGDCMMAVWGAPDRYDDGPERACRAALAIAAAMDADNAARRRRGETPIGLRIGMHTGPVVAGNIGSPGRLNYTVVGDTVNTAWRLDELARNVPGLGEDVRILLSRETARELDAAFAPEYLGRRQVRGRAEGVDVFALRPAGPRVRASAA